MAGMSALAAPMSSAGVVLSQPPSNTTPSSGLAVIDSSTSMLMRLRYSMVVGRMLYSPSDITGNSSGKPPACQTPRLTASATWRRWALQCVSSLQVLQMPMIGRPSYAGSPKPSALKAARRSQPYSSGVSNQARLRYGVVGVVVIMLAPQHTHNAGDPPPNWRG